jgi:hypothetical protein
VFGLDCQIDIYKKKNPPALDGFPGVAGEDFELAQGCFVPNFVVDDDRENSSD